MQFDLYAKKSRIFSGFFCCMYAKFYLSFLTKSHRTPEISKQTAQMAKIIDLSAAAFTTSPILNEATNCGSTTDRLKMPMYKPILV